MAPMILQRLKALGVVLSIAPDGRLAFDAPAGALRVNEIDAMKLWKDELLALISDQSDALKGGINYEKLVICPWCRSSEHLTEHGVGLRCGNCGREAWRFEGEVIVRADWVEPIEVEWPGVQKIEPDKKRPPRVKPTGREQPGLMFGP